MVENLENKSQDKEESKCLYKAPLSLQTLSTTVYIVIKMLHQVFFFLFCYVGQAGLEPVIFLPLLPKYHTSSSTLVVCVLVLSPDP